MEFIQKLLSDETIVSTYNKIDEMNPTPSNHGMKHIQGTLVLAETLAKTLGLSKRELLLAKTALVFHDIGAADGREDHPARSRIFAEKYLKNAGVFSETELQMIYSAIETHDDFGDYSKISSDLSWIVNIADKMDFSASRLSDGYEKKFGCLESEDIDRLEMSLADGEFKIVIKTIENPKIISAEKIYNRNLICKAMTVFEEYCKVKGFAPKLFLESEELYFDKFNKKAMVKR